MHKTLRRFKSRVFLLSVCAGGGVLYRAGWSASLIQSQLLSEIFIRMSLQKKKKTKAVKFILACFYDQPVDEVQRNALIKK